MNRLFIISAIIFTISLTVFAQDSLSTANVTEDTTVTQQIPEGLTANDVLEKYIEAIGGRDALSKIEDKTTIMRGSMMNQNFTIIIKQKSPNKFKQDIRFGDMKQTIIYNGENAYQIGANGNNELTGDQLSSLKTEAEMGFILNPEAYGTTAKLVGIVPVDSVNCYKIEMTDESNNKWYQYFDVDSGLKIKDEKTIKTPQGEFLRETFYEDYQEVDGLKFPFKIRQSFGMQTVDLKVSSLKINTGLKDDLFELPKE